MHLLTTNKILWDVDATMVLVGPMEEKTVSSMFSPRKKLS